MSKLGKIAILGVSSDFRPTNEWEDDSQSPFAFRSSPCSIHNFIEPPGNFEPRSLSIERARSDLVEKASQQLEVEPE